MGVITKEHVKDKNLQVQWFLKVLWHPELNPEEITCLLKMLFMEDEEEFSLSTAIDMFGLSKGKTRHILNSLIDKGLLSRDRNPDSPQFLYDYKLLYPNNNIMTWQQKQKYLKGVNINE